MGEAHVPTAAAPAVLRTYTAKQLGQLAKRNGIRGWHSMRKDELVKALAGLEGIEASTFHRVARDQRGPQTQKPPRPKPLNRQIRKLHSRLEQVKHIDTPSANSVERDRLVVMVRDPYWLHAYWELSRQSVQRAQAAMGQHWHTAKPVLRVMEVAENGAATVTRDIHIHGGVNNWYVDVQEPPKCFQLSIGYLVNGGSYHSLSRSNTVTTPPAGTSKARDEIWVDVAENADRIYAMSGGYSHHGTSQELQEVLEERLRRPMGSPMSTRFGVGAGGLDCTDKEFHLAVDAEIIVYGVTHRDAHVTLQGEPVRLQSDGTFSVRLSMPDRRQVIPVVASDSDGVQQRTIVIAVERNTKSMEPILRDHG